MPILEVNDITKSFGRTEVLKGISFSLERGQPGQQAQQRRFARA